MYMVYFKLHMEIRYNTKVEKVKETIISGTNYTTKLPRLHYLLETFGQYLEITF